MIESMVRVGGHATRYLEAGDRANETVLLLHDGAWGGSSSVTWGNSIGALAQHFHVLAPDLLGFGGTDKVVYFDRSTYEPRIDHVTRFLASVGVDRPVHVVGNSFGGSLALRMLAHPGRPALRSVTSINGTGGPWRTPTALEDLSRWDGSESDLDRIVAQLIEPFDGWDDQIRERMRWAAAPGHYRSVASVGVPVPDGLKEERPTDPWPQQLRDTDTPVLLIAGTRDTLLEPGWTDHFALLGDRLSVATLDARHEPNIDRPDILVPVLLEFLSRTT
ncbi:alpha/beta fold hydrolase [Nocardioides sp. NPDC051685]|uniref:alpha/beta fold hydrolase n=1 Tax=Nocardioides sp. NPDC051685 TaxID=3364334 RepID=UPI0037AC352E